MADVDLIALAEKCEAAAGPDLNRSLMCEAFRAVHPEISAGAWDAIDEWDAIYDSFCGMLDARAPESAATLLVPESCLFTMRTLWDGPIVAGYAHVSLYCADAEDSDGKRHLEDFFGIAVSPALALCAAALRARASQHNHP